MTVGELGELLEKCLLTRPVWVYDPNDENDPYKGIESVERGPLGDLIIYSDSWKSGAKAEESEAGFVHRAIYPELRKCPFCGGAAEVPLVPVTGVDAPDFVAHYPSCRNRRCLGYNLLVYGCTMSQAIKLWNGSEEGCSE